MLVLISSDIISSHVEDLQACARSLEVKFKRSTHRVHPCYIEAVSSGLVFGGPPIWRWITTGLVMKDDLDEDEGFRRSDVF
jgi:hypothetical protein